MADKFDVIVVGGGPGGYVAAIRAARAEKRARRDAAAADTGQTEGSCSADST